MKNIILVDDDAGIREAVADYLEKHDFAVRTAEGAEQMDTLLAQHPCDLLILDLMMPGEDGLSICRRLERGGPPILMLSALGETTDRIVGLEIGASDYLAKPFEPRELLARVRALLRLTERSPAAPSEAPEHVHFEGWTLEAQERRLIDPQGKAIPLTGGELSLLKVFVERPNRILTRDQLLSLARGPDADGFDRAIDLAVSRLRGKLKPDGARFIETIRGEGYRFTVRAST